MSEEGVAIAPGAGPGAPVPQDAEGLRVLFLSEGDPESAVESGSGTPASVIAALRRRGAIVRAADVDLAGPAKLLAAGLSYSSDRARWKARYHLDQPGWRLRSQRAATAVAAAGAVDVVLQYGGTFSPAPTNGIPYCLFCDNNVLNVIDQPLSWGAALSSRELEQVVARERALYQGAACIFTFSDYVRRAFLERYDVPAARVRVVGSGPNLDLSRIPHSRGPRAVDAPPTILFVGRDWEGKGGPIVLEAFRRVRAAVPDARLLVIGPAQLALDEPGVEVLGFLRKDVDADLDRLIAAYASADVFCLPTRYESFGIAVLEAMWFGLPTVVPGRWAIPEMVRDGETGTLVMDERPDSYAEALIALLRDPDRAGRLGNAGRARAAASFTWDHVASGMAENFAIVARSTPG